MSVQDVSVTIKPRFYMAHGAQCRGTAILYEFMEDGKRQYACTVLPWAMSPNMIEQERLLFVQRQNAG